MKRNKVHIQKSNFFDSLSYHYQLMDGYAYPPGQKGDKGEHMITDDENFSKWASESPESPESPVSPAPTSKHPVGVERITPPSLSGAQGSQPLSDLAESPERPVSPVDVWESEGFELTPETNLFTADETI